MFKKGQWVISKKYGPGKITNTFYYGNFAYPVDAVFSGGLRETFTADGRRLTQDKEPDITLMENQQFPAISN